MISTLAPRPAQNARSFSTAAGSVPSGGVRMHQRLMKSSGKPESGPECSVPATGWAGTKWTPCGICGPMSRAMAPLTEPTSETIAPASRNGAISSATGPQAPTGMQRITRSAPLTASALVSSTRSTTPSSATRARLLAECAVATISLAKPWARAARAIEPPIRPKPISATRLKRSSVLTSLARHEVAQAVDDEPVGLLGADGHAQRMRQAVIVQRPQHQAALGQIRVGVDGGLALFLREMDQHKIRHARRDFQTELGNFLRQPV